MYIDRFKHIKNINKKNEQDSRALADQVSQRIIN